MVKTEERNGWSDVLPELLELVVQKLVMTDYLKCRQVCRSWQNIVNNAIKNKCPFVPQCPSLLLLPPAAFRCNEDLFTLVDIPQNNHNQQFMIPHAWEGNSASVLSEEEGWLIFEDDNHDHMLWIFNPVSREKYRLPQLPLDHIKDYNPITIPIVRFAFSSQSLLVAMSFSYVDDKDGLISEILFCKVDNGKSWTRIETNESHSGFTDIVLLGCILYAMNSDTVTIFNLRDQAERLVMQLPKQEVDDDGGERVTCRLAKDATCGQVLLVFCKTKDFKLQNIHMFKLDMRGPKWIKVDNLNGRVLLIDGVRAQVISSTNLNVSPGFIKEGGNCVFYSLHQDGMNPYLVVYLLKEKIFDRSLNVNFPSSITSCRGLWFTPCPW